MRNITKQIKDAIAVDAVWRISDFFDFIENLNNNGFKTSNWQDEENWATLLFKDTLIGYIWQKYPLIFIKEDCEIELMTFLEEYKYIIIIKSKDLTIQEFSIDMDQDLLDRIDYGLDTKKFSANDFWFHTVT